MDYINRLNNYDMSDISMANDLFKKAELQREAAKALIDYISSIERTEFISAPNVDRIQEVAERCYGEAMYEAAKILFNSIANFARPGTCLVHLGQHQAIHAAQPTSSCSTSFLLDVEVHRDVRVVQQLRQEGRLLLPQWRAAQD